MYSVYDYGSFISDKIRRDAYVQALRQGVKPNSVVVDIGTGTGIWALLACKFGARRVYAIDPNEAISVAKEIAAANGFAERIQFIQKLSTEVSLPERADVIVSDLRGMLPLFQHHLSSIVDARQRFLKPGGVLIPQRDTMWAAVVEAADLYRPYTAPWDDNAYGLNMEAARKITTNTWRRGRVKPEKLLMAPKCWAMLDYPRIEKPDASGQVSWSAVRDGTAHGLSVWFDSELAESVSISNSPSTPELIYSSAFFPFSKPIMMTAGDTISVEIYANLVGEDYIWRWNTFVLSQGKRDHVKADFKQSTFYSMSLSQATLRKIAHNHNPILNGEGQIDQFALSLMDGQTPLGEIAHRIMEKFPKHFSKWYDALTHVSNVSLKYSR
jgi:type I protein arginine methyltransferase